MCSSTAEQAHQSPENKVAQMQLFTKGRALGNELLGNSSQEKWGEGTKQGCALGQTNDSLVSLGTQEHGLYHKVKLISRQRGWSFVPLCLSVIGYWLNARGWGWSVVILWGQVALIQLRLIL